MNGLSGRGGFDVCDDDMDGRTHFGGQRRGACGAGGTGIAVVTSGQGVSWAAHWRYRFPTAARAAFTVCAAVHAPGTHYAAAAHTRSVPTLRLTPPCFPSSPPLFCWHAYVLRFSQRAPRACAAWMLLLRMASFQRRLPVLPGRRHRSLDNAFSACHLVLQPLHASAACPRAAHAGITLACPLVDWPLIEEDWTCFVGRGLLFLLVPRLAFPGYLPHTLHYICHWFLPTCCASAQQCLSSVLLPLLKLLFRHWPTCGAAVALCCFLGASVAAGRDAVNCTGKPAHLPVDSFFVVCCQHFFFCLAGAFTFRAVGIATLACYLCRASSPTVVWYCSPYIIL